MATFLLEIITPERIAYQENVDMVVAPSLNGEVGILPNHVPYFIELKEGEVRVVKGSEEFFLAIGGGFLEVTPEKTAILVTKAVHAEEINEMEMEKAKQAAENALKQKPEGNALLEAQSLLRSSLVNLNVIRKNKSHRSHSSANSNQHVN